MYLQENNIKKLPNEISNLTRLTHLDVSRNHLKCLPEPVGYLRNLVSLNVGDNKFLQQLPKTLGHAQKLQHLGLDNLNLSYPPVDVLDGGAVVIVAFLAAECGIEYSTRLEDSEKNQNDDASQREIHNKENEIQVKDFDVRIKEIENEMCFIRLLNHLENHPVLYFNVDFHVCFSRQY